jgi:hypothetical protein
MPTSGSTNFSTNRDSLIAGALRLCGAIAQGETPSATLVNESAEALNMLVKALQADGMPLWALKQYSVPLTAATASYRIGVSQTINTPKPLKIIQAFLRETSSGLDIPMTQLTRIDYNFLGNKTTAGTPIQYYYDVQNSYGDLYLFPVPTTSVASDYTVQIVYQRPFEDFDTSTDEPDFPQEWYDALKHLLADRLAPEHGLALAERQDLARRAKTLKDEALGFGTEEGSIHFQASLRNW